MSKVYPSNLTQAQYEFLSDLIPEAKSGGRKREVDMWEVLNGIFYILVEGVRWRSLPGDFPPWQRVYTYFRNWRKDGTWLHIHDSLREWTRIEQDRYPSPSEAIIDWQCPLHHQHSFVSEGMCWNNQDRASLPGSTDIAGVTAVNSHTEFVEISTQKRHTFTYAGTPG